jgi:predicted heme/steroid binding protein
MLKKTFTLEELKKYNGKNGSPAFVACQGKVYDVSSSFLWQQGNHEVLHNAGADLTNQLNEAPHGIELLEKFPVVGILHNTRSD